MLPTELTDLITEILHQKCEKQNIELKSASKGVPKRLYDTLSSFANQTGGGIIIFGIDEKADYGLAGVYNVQDLQIQVTNQALQMEPVVRPVFTVVEIDGKSIVSAEISECNIYDKPCFYKGAGRIRGSYIRVGEADMPMTEYEIYSYEAFKRKIQDELRIVERADSEDFDQNRLAEYLIKLRGAKPNLSKLSDEKILQLQGFVDRAKPTVAGLMLLGEYPQGFFPQLSMTAVVVAGTEIGPLGKNGERFIDNQRIEGNITQMLEEAMAFIRRNSRKSTIVNQDGKRVDRSEYPMTAVREILLNALVHRDYSIHTDRSPIRILLFSDRLEVENPGGLYGRITINELGTTAADTRNPFLAGGLEVMDETENRFSGIPTIMYEMEQAGLPPAIFESRGGRFKVTLYNHSLKDESILSETEKKILSFCIIPRSRTEITETLGLETPSYVVKKYLQPLIAAGLLQYTLPDKPKSKKQKYVVTKDH